MKITIVLPTYNEAENLPKLVPALFALPLDLGLLIVDDNSPDGTGEMAEEYARLYPGRVAVHHRSGKLGLGTAYIQGFALALQQADVDVIGQMDSDFSHPPEKLVEMAAKLEAGDCDVIIGSRYVPGGSVDKNWPLYRKGLSAWGSFYARTILGLNLRDVTGGFRLFRREVHEQIPWERIRSNGYAFQVETAYLLHKLGYCIQEVPIYFADRKWGQSKMSLRIQLEAALRVWQVLFAYRDVKSIRRS